MKKILIADNSELNRSMLYEIFASQYEILRTDSGEDAFRLILENRDELAAVLIGESIASHISKETALTLSALKVFEDVPMIYILENEASVLKRNKFIIPFSEVIDSPVNPYIAKKRVANLIEFFSNKKALEKLVSDQKKKILQQNRELREQQKKINTINTDMLDTLSMVIEYRDVESGRHIHRIRKFTEVLLRILAEKYPKYNLNEDKIELITSASSIHDIGKIAIPDSILLSPKRLTFEEFRIMKQHTIKGCEILDQLDSVEKNEYFRYCYDICRYHHEKWDGMGYPDGLVGDQIPIWAQVVSLADCYDALTSDRPYKSAYSHDQAVEMIRTGACGAFSDEMMDCFSTALPKFRELAIEYADVNNADRNVTAPVRETVEKNDKEDHSKDIYVRMDRSDLIETIEHLKKVVSDMQRRDHCVLDRISDFVLDFDIRNDMLHERKGTMKDICGYVPKNYEETVNILSDCCMENCKPEFSKVFRLRSLRERIENGEDCIIFECLMDIGDQEYTDVRCTAVPLTENGNIDRVCFIITRLHKNSIDHPFGSDRDIVTGLWNYTGVKREIDDYIENNGKNGYHALVMIDIDDFRSVNRAAGYRFGNDILCDITNLLKYQISGNNILGRIEDDNFVVFINDCPDKEERDLIIEDIFNCIHKTYIFGEERTPDIPASLGIALYPKDGDNFDELFSKASKAVEIAKLNGKNMYLYYNRSMNENWELKKIDSSFSVRERSDLEVSGFEEYFIPVTDSASGYIFSYEMIGVNDEFISKLTSVTSILEEAVKHENITALCLNNLNHLFASLYSLQHENIALPELCVLTMFDGNDSGTVLSALDDMLEKHPIDCRNICFMLSHDMLGSMSSAEISEFCSQLKNMGFRVGVFNVGVKNINVNCFISGMFERIAFSRDFIRSVSDDVYDMGILESFISYFDRLGTKCILPGGTSEELVFALRQKTSCSFGIHKEELITLDDFRMQMNASSIVREYPALSHERTSLVLNEKMYDEILEQTKSFIMEWSPRLDKIKLSGSFGNIYGYQPETDDFVRDLSGNKMIHSDDKKKLIEKMNAARSEHNESEAFVRVYSKKSDEYLWNRVRFVTIRNAADIPVRIMAVFTDITDSRSDPIDYRRKDRTDFITNLYNKHATENKIKNYLYDEGAGSGHSFLIAEICGFDTLEHSLGAVFANAVLKEAAQNIRELFRDSDIIGRSTGSRFIVFIKGLDDKAKVQEKAEQICRIINNSYQSDNGEITVFGKIGISLFPTNGSTYDELYSAALKALYFAKHNIRCSTAFVSDANNSTKLLHS